MIIQRNRGLLNLEKQLSKVNENHPKMGTADYMVAFSGLTNSYCIGIVDMVNSTKISAEMNEIEWCQYYEIFLNSMAKILPKFGGTVIKNQGDSLLFYFPETSKATEFGFKRCLESGLSLIEEHDTLCENLKKQGLPRLNYRVSIDYGKVVMMNSNNSSTPDLIGPPVNMCSKINHLAENNGVVIGGDLYQNVKQIKDYHYSQKKGFSVGFKYTYPVYAVTRS